MSTPRHAAFITGSSRGIGLATAVDLARSGFDIALNGRADDAELAAAENAVAAEGAKTVRVPGDVAAIGSQQEMLERAEAAIGPLSTLVNNAGVSVLSRGDLLDVSEESYDRCMAVNAKAQFFMSQAFARRVVKRIAKTAGSTASSTCPPPMPWRSPSSAVNIARRKRRLR